MNMIFVIKPNMFKFSISKGLYTCLFLPLKIVALCCLPLMHALQIVKDVGQKIWLRFRPFIGLWNAWKLFTCKCPCRWYRSLNAPSSLKDCIKLAYMSMYLSEVHFVQLRFTYSRHNYFSIQTLQYIYLHWIKFSTHWMKCCSSRVNLLATWTHERYIWCKVSLFSMSPSS